MKCFVLTSLKEIHGLPNITRTRVMRVLTFTFLKFCLDIYLILNQRKLMYAAFASLIFAFFANLLILNIAVAERKRGSTYVRPLIVHLRYILYGRLLTFACEFVRAKSIKPNKRCCLVIM